MSLITLGAYLILPSSIYTSPDGTAGVTLDAAGEYVSWIFKIPKTGTLKKIGVRIGVLTVADDMVLRVETVDASTGKPTGTLYASGATGTATPSGPYTTSWINLNGSTGIRVTKDDLVAVKLLLDYVDGNIQIITKWGLGPFNFPYCYSYYNSTDNFVMSGALMLGLEYDGELVHAPGLGLVMAGTSAAWSTAAFRKGLVLQVPFKCRAVGAIIRADIDNDATFEFYDSDQATILESVLIDKDIRGSSGLGGHYIPFSSSHILMINTNYRAVIRPSGGGNITYYYLTGIDDAPLKGLDMLEMGSAWHYTECNGAPTGEASWTDTTSQRPHFGIVIDQLDDGAGSGGGLPILGGSVVR